MTPLTTHVEVIGVFLGLAFLAIVGLSVTPTSPSFSRSVSVDPVETIRFAQEGYQLDQCVEAITPHVVLSQEKVGERAQMMVLAGEPITACFPEMASVSQSDNAKTLKTTKDYERSFGADVRTSVTVLPPANANSVSAATTPGTPTTTPFFEDSTDFTASSTTAVRSEEHVSNIPSGGTVGEQVIPTIDRFEICRQQLFGDMIPETVNETEQQAFEVCLFGS